MFAHVYHFVTECTLALLRLSYALRNI